MVSRENELKNEFSVCIGHKLMHLLRPSVASVSGHWWSIPIRRCLVPSWLAVVAWAVERPRLVSGRMHALRSQRSASCGRLGARQPAIFDPPHACGSNQSHDLGELRLTEHALCRKDGRAWSVFWDRIDAPQLAGAKQKLSNRLGICHLIQHTGQHTFVCHA